MDELIGSDFVVVEWRDPGGTGWIAPPHVHHEDDEAWYVLEGTLRFRLGDRELDAPAGSGVLASRGIPHTFGNFTQDPARYLLVTTPRVRQLIDDLHSGEHEDVGALFRLHASELLS